MNNDKLLLPYGKPYTLVDDDSYLLDTGIIQWRAQPTTCDDRDGQRIYTVMITGSGRSDSTQITYFPSESYLSISCSGGDYVRFPCKTAARANLLVELYIDGHNTRELAPANRGIHWGGTPCEL